MVYSVAYEPPTPSKLVVITLLVGLVVVILELLFEVRELLLDLLDHSLGFLQHLLLVAPVVGAAHRYWRVAVSVLLHGLGIATERHVRGDAVGALELPRPPGQTPAVAG